MKKILMFVIICLPIFAKAQYVDSLKSYNKYTNYIWKGDFIINAYYTKNNKYKVGHAPYGTQGGEVNLGYYIVNRLGLESGVSTNHYNYLLTNQQDPNQLNKKNLVLLNERIRYHFYQHPRAGTAYLQTGYSYGWFNGGISKKIHLWEIASLGIHTTFTRQYIPNLDMEIHFSLSKDNLSSNVLVLYKMGLAYYLGNLKKKN